MILVSAFCLLLLLSSCASYISGKSIRVRRQLGPQGFGPFVNWNRATNVGFPFGAVQNGQGGNVDLPFLNGLGWGRFGGILRNRDRPGPAFGFLRNLFGPPPPPPGGPPPPGLNPPDRPPPPPPPGPQPGVPGGVGPGQLPTGSVNVGRGTNVAFPFGGVGVSRGVNVAFPFG